MKTTEFVLSEVKAGRMTPDQGIEALDRADQFDAAQVQRATVVGWLMVLAVALTLIACAGVLR